MTYKNLIYIVAIDDPGSKVSVNDYFKYSLPTWEFYCRKYGIDLVVERNHKLASDIKPIWNKELIYEVGKGYNKIGIVDCDTMVRWDAPNIFDLFPEDDFCGVNDLCDLNWLFSSIKSRQFLFPDTALNIDCYINAGMLFFGAKHLNFFERLLSFYISNKKDIDSIQGGGREQTLLNYLLQKDSVNIRLLEPAWNLLSIHRKNMFTHNWQLETNGIPHFIKYSYVWHFTGFPIEDRISVMEQTWEITKHRYYDS